MKLSAILKKDVAVIGGGPAGAAIALELTKAGYSTVVIEQSDYRGVRIGETLPPAVQPLLVSLGIWDEFRAQEHSPAFGIRSAWGRDELYDNDFIFNAYGLGWHVDRTRFDQMLAGCAEDAGAKVYRSAQLLSSENEHGNWKIEIVSDDRKRRFSTKFLVDASGRSSWVARHLGAKRIIWDCLIGVVGFFTMGSVARTSDSFTLIEAAEQGWWYSAVLPDSRLVVAYMTDGDTYANGQRQSPNYWLRQLEKTAHTRSRVESYIPASEPRIVAANTFRLDQLANGNWLAIGDAAMAFDPLSGQGVYKALQSALRAAQSLDQFWTGNTSALHDYAMTVGRDFHRYLVARQAFYSAERRWPASTFWRRRI